MEGDMEFKIKLSDCLRIKPRHAAFAYTFGSSIGKIGIQRNAKSVKLPAVIISGVMSCRKISWYRCALATAEICPAML